MKGSIPMVFICGNCQSSITAINSSQWTETCPCCDQPWSDWMPTDVVAIPEQRYHLYGANLFAGPYDIPYMHRITISDLVRDVNESIDLPF